MLSLENSSKRFEALVQLKTILLIQNNSINKISF